MDTIESIDAQIAELQARRANLMTNKRIALRNERSAKARRIPIVSKTRNQRGMSYGGDETGMFAEFGTDDQGRKTIHLTGRYANYADVDRKFAEGDTAVYDSFNFDFLGTITKISDKSVTIEPQFGSRTKRLDLATFANRNYKFDLEKSNEQRASWSD